MSDSVARAISAEKAMSDAYKAISPVPTMKYAYTALSHIVIYNRLGFKGVSLFKLKIRDRDYFTFPAFKDTPQ